MKTIPTTLTFMAALGCLFSLTQAQTITLDQFNQLLKERHPLFTREALAPAIAQNERDQNRGSEDWMISSGPSFARQVPLPPGGFTPEQVNFTSINAGVDRVFWKTGGRLSLRWQSDLSDQTLDLSQMAAAFKIPEDVLAGPNKYYQNNAYLTYSQPLLQNFGGELDRLAYDMGGFSVEAAQVQALENQEEFLLDMGLRFIDWVLVGEQADIASERLELARQILDQSKKKRAANLIDQVDVLRSEDAVRIAEQGVVLLRAQVNGTQAELAVIAQHPELTGLDPDFDLYATAELPEATAAAAGLKQGSRVLKVLAVQQQLLERQHTGFKEMTRPHLYLTTQMTLKSGDAKFGDALSLDENDLGVSLQFSYPLGNRAAVNRAQKSELQVRQVELARNDVALSLEAGLRNILIQMGEFERALDLNRRQIESAKLRTTEEQKRYGQGRGDLAFVIQSQDSEEQARLTYAQNAATYQGLNLRLMALLDELLVD